MFVTYRLGMRSVTGLHAEPERSDICGIRIAVGPPCVHTGRYVLRQVNGNNVFAGPRIDATKAFLVLQLLRRRDGRPARCRRLRRSFRTDVPDAERSTARALRTAQTVVGPGQMCGSDRQNVRSERATRSGAVRCCLPSRPR